MRRVGLMADRRRPIPGPIPVPRPPPVPPVAATKMEVSVYFPGLAEVVEKFCKKKKEYRFDYSVGPVTRKERKRETMLEINITNEQQVNVVLHPVTETGRPAQVDGVPTWTVQSGDAAVNAASDGMSADLVSSDTPGDTQVLVEADADLGSGVITISDIITLHVNHANAANLGLVAGDPTPKP